MSGYDPNDPLGLGFGIGINGMDASVPHGQVASFQLVRDPAVRRTCMAQIVTWLEKHRGPHTFEDVLEGVSLSYIEQSARNTVYRDLAQNEKVLAPDADHLQYRAKHTGVSNMKELAEYMHRFPDGLPEDELADSYHGVQADVVALLANGSLLAIDHLERKRRILFPVQKDLVITGMIDVDLRNMWHAIVMPRSQVDIEEKLTRAGHMTDEQRRTGHLVKSRELQAQLAKSAAAKRAQDDARRAARKRYNPRTKMTNSHLLGQFEWFNTPGEPPSKKRANA